MSNIKRKMPTPVAKQLRRDPLASLRMADMMISKPVLPAEIIATIVDYLAVPDLLRFALVSRRTHEMVYDDTRWIRRLKRMGCWDDTEARKRAEIAAANASGPATTGIRRQSTIDRSLVNGKGRPEILFSADSSTPTTRRKLSVLSPVKPRHNIGDGFDAVQMASPVDSGPNTNDDLQAALSILKRVNSIRGQARQEYGRVYKALAPYYNDALSCVDPMRCLVFENYTIPEHQAQMLAQIRTFAASDLSPGSTKREYRLQQIVDHFDTVALLEFRKGYEYKDIRGRMRQYAHVMHTLNGGRSSVELYLHDNRIITQKTSLGNVGDCIDYSLGYGQLSLERVQVYFERLAQAYSQESAIVQTVFPNAREVSMLLLDKVGQEILAPFLGELIVEAQSRSKTTYLRVISGTFAAVRHFVTDFGIPKDSDEEIMLRSNAVMTSIYEPHLDTYLAEELDSFKLKADAEVDQWDRALSEQAASTETFLMSNVNRQAEKKDFMTSFKKVVMMPVNILPSFSGSLNHKSAAKALVSDEASIHSRPATPSQLAPRRTATPSLPAEAPTSELAAQAALMTSKLDNIKSLFSIEVALNLVHAAKSPLERAAQFITLGGACGEAARLQCSAIFIMLLQAIGVRHVKAGFDKAIDSLAAYNPRDANMNVTDNNTVQVAPLTTFLELVNVGDLIQQMLDVFYESELVRLRVSNRDDFLDPNVKEKKKFEAMLDERVAAGLGKGIDVLMDEVEYICGTTQLPTDFNPESDLVVDIGPTRTAKRVIEVVGSHTSMLMGATDKSLLDVFTTEVGLRLHATICKHIKRQRISTAGALPLLSDLTAYASYVAGFKNNDLNSYFIALREVGQIYLIEGKTDRDVGEMATIISDADRYAGIFTVEEVVEFAERRSDWLVVRSRVEGKVRGESCLMM